MMDVSWIVFLVVVAFCTYRGYRAGLLGSLSQVVGLAVGYMVALLYYPWAAAVLQRYTGVQGVLAYVAGGIALFVVANFAIALLFFGIKKILSLTKPRGRLAIAGGVVTGLLFGVVWGLLAVFTLSYTRDTLIESDAPRPHNIIERLAHSVVARAVEQVAQISDADPAVRGVSAALARDPQTVSQQLRRVSQSPALKSLFSAADNAAVLQSADTDAIVALPAFRQLLNNPDFRQLMQVAGMDATQGVAYEQQVARRFSQVWNRIHSLKNNDRVQTLLQDPDLKAQLESRNPVQLLTNAHFMELVQLILSPTENALAESVDKLTPTSDGDDPALIYRWTDADGQLHFSDQPPDVADRPLH